MFGQNEKFFIEDPKASFWIGLAAGVAVMCTVGFIILLVNFFSDDNTLAKNANTEQLGDAGDTLVAGDQAPTAPTAPSGPVDIKISEQDQMIGNPNAKITVVEFSDFQCPFCERFHPTAERVLDEYGDKVRWVFKHFPLDSIHPNARPAAMASECAGEQGKFWEFADELFTNQSLLGDSYYRELAGTLGLNTGKFNECLDSNKYADKVNNDYQAGVAAGVRGTPASFINGQMINGAQPYEVVKAAIDSLL